MIETAKRYNSVQFNRRRWLLGDLPTHLAEIVAAHGPGSGELARFIEEYQRYFKLPVDGKLGPATLEAIKTYFKKYPEMRDPAGFAQDEAWSPLVKGFRKTRATLRRRENAPKFLICHTTGSGVLRHPDPLEWALDYYSGPKAYTSHYLIDWEGGLWGIVPENEVAYHAGINDADRALYARGPKHWAKFLRPVVPSRPPWPERIISLEKGRVEFDTGFAGFDWWFERWLHHNSPLDITGDPNGESIGVDLLAHKGGFTDKQHSALKTFVKDCQERYGLLPLLGHSDVHPIQRCDLHGPWDPRELLIWPVFQR